MLNYLSVQDAKSTLLILCLRITMAENKVTDKLIENRDIYYPGKYWGYTYNILLLLFLFEMIDGLLVAKLPTAKYFMHVLDGNKLDHKIDEQ